MKYKSVVATQRGGPEFLQVSENDLREPAAGEARIKVLATCVGRTDINYRGITTIYMCDKKPFMEDLPKLFKLLEEGKIKPIIAARLPILEAAKANALLESGQVTGNIVLLAPELL